MKWESKKIFLDTNILIYASVKESPFHKEAVNKINQLYEASLLISRQIIREYLSVMSKPGIFKTHFRVQYSFRELNSLKPILIFSMKMN